MNLADISTSDIDQAVATLTETPREDDRETRTLDVPSVEPTTVLIDAIYAALGEWPRVGRMVALVLVMALGLAACGSGPITGTLAPDAESSREECLEATLSYGVELSLRIGTTTSAEELEALSAELEALAESCTGTEMEDGR